jgi:hypothetical protein
MKTALLTIVALLALCVPLRAADAPSPGLIADTLAGFNQRAALALDTALTLQVANPVTATNVYTTNSPPTLQGGVQEIVDAVSSATNWDFAAYGLYASGLTHKAGGGLAALYSVSQYVVTGIRIDYVDGAFWMPAVTATFQLPLQVTSWLKLTPFAVTGIGIPISGASFGDINVPGGTPIDNNGQPTAIYGAGGAVHILSFDWLGKHWNGDIVFDEEHWTGFPGTQYRGGALLNLTASL